MATRRSQDLDRESRDEIAELEAELRRAYVAKELRAQIAERQVERYAEKARSRRRAELQRRELRESLEADELAHRSRVASRKADLLEETRDRLMRKALSEGVAAEVAMCERASAEEVSRRREKLEKETRSLMKRELAENALRERRIRMETQAIRVDLEREAEELWKRDRLEYELSRVERQVESEKLAKELAGRRERALLAAAKAILEEDPRERDRIARSLLEELMGEEIRLEILAMDASAEAERLATRRRLAVDLEEQIRDEESCKLRFVERDRIFAEELARKIARDERIAKLTVEASRRARLRHREEVERIVRERRAIRERERLEIERAREEERLREEAVRTDAVAEERTRLLTAHASNVGEFLDRDALTSAERLAFLLEDPSQSGESTREKN